MGETNDIYELHSLSHRMHKEESGTVNLPPDYPIGTLGLEKLETAMLRNTAGSAADGISLPQEYALPEARFATRMARLVTLQPKVPAN